MNLFLYREFAITESIPQLDGLVSGPGNDLAVVGGERNREDIVRVPDEPSRRGSGREFPETEGFVPGGGEGVCTV